MIKLIGKCFSGCISFLAVVLLLAGGVGGYFGFEALYYSTHYFYNSSASMAYQFGGALLGIVLAFIIDVIVFGFVVQIINIRKSLENIEQKLEKTNLKSTNLDDTNPGSTN